MYWSPGPPLMFSPAYHFCIHGVFFAIIVALLREYWTISALTTHNHVASDVYSCGETDEGYVSETCSQTVPLNSAISSNGRIYGGVRAEDDVRSFTYNYDGYNEKNSKDSKPVDEVVKEEKIEDHDMNFRLQRDGSSVWCTGSNHTDRQCRFQNLCFFPEHDGFGFLHSARSVRYGVPLDRFSPALLDLSSIRDHNTQYFNYVDLPSKVISGRNVKVIEADTLIFHRFNADNLMHVFHDDLLPIFSTLRLLKGASLNMESESSSNDNLLDFQLLFMEGWLPGQYKRLYQLFSKYPNIYKSELIADDTVTCFRSSYLGLNKDTTWYQYGFKQPQGPIQELTITSREIRQFTNFFNNLLFSKVLPDKGETLEKNKLLDSMSDTQEYAVLFTRRENRVILNQMEVALGVAKKYNMKVYSVGIETHNLEEIIKLVQSSSLLIGMHGSMLILTMFLPPGALLVELFPYAVEPTNYTPYRTLSKLHGMGLFYRAWSVENREHTVTHPDRPWDSGGIRHLSEASQYKIEHSTRVPPHLCCRDPEWLFRIYQDSHVDMESLYQVIDSGMQQRMTFLAPQPQTLPDYQPLKQFPTQVSHIECVGSSRQTATTLEPPPPSLDVTWEVPWNLEYLEASEVSYEVWIQESSSDHYSAWILPRPGHRFTLGLKESTTYSIWVRCILNNQVIGPFNQQHITCTT